MTVVECRNDNFPLKSQKGFLDGKFIFVKRCSETLNDVDPPSKWKFKIRARFRPQQPFSPSTIIQDRIFDHCPLSNFTFDVYLGTS